MRAHIVLIGKSKAVNIKEFSDSEWITKQAECAKECPDLCFTDYIEFEDEFGPCSVEYCFALTFNSDLFKYQACIVYHGQDDYLYVNDYGYVEVDEYSYIAIRDMAIKFQEASIELALKG